MAVTTPNILCPNALCNKPLLIENKNDVIEYLCEHCEKGGLPRFYLQLNYAYNKQRITDENIQTLVTIAYVSHRLIMVG